MTRHVGAEVTADLPVFSPRLDEVMAAMIKGEAPNAGRFCGYCYTPLSRAATVCPHCGTATDDYAPVDRLPREFGQLYRRMRRRESLIVNSFAFAGLGLGVLIFIALVAVAVYLMDASLWMLGFATLVLLVGGRVFAGLLGGWIGDDIGYRYARRKLAEEWPAYERWRDEQAGRAPRAPAAGAAPQAEHAPR
jgi:hypothetical protein